MGSYTTSELERDTGFGRRTIAYYVQERLLPRVGRRGPRTRYPELVRDRLLFIRRVREAEAEGVVRPVSLSRLRELFEALPAGLVASVAAGETAVDPDIVSLSAIEQRSMVDRVSALRKRLLDARPAPAQAARVRIREEEGLQLRSLAPLDFDEDGADEVRVMDELGPVREAPPDAEELHAAAPPAREASAARYPARRSPGSRPEEDADTHGKQLSWVLNELQAQARRRRERAPGDAVHTWSQVEVTSDIRLSIRGMAEEDAFLLRVAGRLLRQVLENPGPLVEGSSDELEE